MERAFRHDRFSSASRIRQQRIRWTLRSRVLGFESKLDAINHCYNILLDERDLGNLGTDQFEINRVKIENAMKQITDKTSDENVDVGIMSFSSENTTFQVLRSGYWTEAVSGIISEIKERLGSLYDFLYDDEANLGHHIEDKMKLCDILLNPEDLCTQYFIDSFTLLCAFFEDVINGDTTDCLDPNANTQLET